MLRLHQGSPLKDVNEHKRVSREASVSKYDITRINSNDNGRHYEVRVLVSADKINRSLRARNLNVLKRRTLHTIG